MIELRLLTTADVEDLYPRLRIEDQEECIVLGSNPREALVMGSLDNIFDGVSKGRAYGLWHDGIIIGALGFTSAGYLWALSTKFTLSQIRELFTRTPEIHQRLLKEASGRGVFIQNPLHEPAFHNLIHARNRVSLKWLERSGEFIVDKDFPIEVGGEVFYPFRSLTPTEKATFVLPLASLTPEEAISACALH